MTASDTPSMSSDPTHVSAPNGRIEESADDLDALVQRASTPSLASLFQAGKDAGLIKAGKEYGNST